MAALDRNDPGQQQRPRRLSHILRLISFLFFDESSPHRCLNFFFRRGSSKRRYGAAVRNEGEHSRALLFRREPAAGQVARQQQQCLHAVHGREQQHDGEGEKKNAASRNTQQNGDVLARAASGDQTRRLTGGDLLTGCRTLSHRPSF